MKPQRFLASAGFGSRRACEQLILAGRVTINGEPLTFNIDVLPNDVIKVDNNIVGGDSELVYIALNKPVGYISDRGIPDARSALDLVKLPQRLFAVGRLDKDATGLLLLTNDGELGFHLTHPSFEHEKEYRVLVQGNPDENTLNRWREGLLLNGEMTAKAQIIVESRRSDDTWLRVILHEGRKRQIKRIAKLLGHPVKQLMRVRIGSLLLGDLQPGEWRQLTPKETLELSNP
jgi:23S rRNA pseudouridine2605 synthase